MMGIRKNIDLQEYQQIKPGDIIVSSPYAKTDAIFYNSVIYIISHSEDRISGVIINKLLNQIDNKTISKSLSINDAEHLNNPLIVKNMPIYFGGPVEQGKRNNFT